MHAVRGLSGETVAAAQKLQPGLARSREPHLRPHRRAIGGGSLEQKLDPMSACRQRVVVEVRRRVGIGDKQIEAAVVIKIGHGNTPPVAD